MSRSRKVPYAEQLAPLRRQLQEWRKVRRPGADTGGPLCLRGGLGQGVRDLPYRPGPAFDYTALRKRVERPVLRQPTIRPEII